MSLAGTNQKIKHKRVQVNQKVSTKFPVKLCMLKMPLWSTAAPMSCLRRVMHRETVVFPER